VRTKNGGEKMSPAGRPPKDNPKNERIYIRVTKEEKEKIQKFTKEYDCTCLDLIFKGIESVEKQ
jgi:hypothetical protein